MGSDTFAFALLAWLSTYALHSTVLLGAAWIATLAFSKLRSNRGLSAALRQTIWRTAMLGPIATATLQISTGIAPFQAHWSLAGATSSATNGPREAPPVVLTAARPSTGTADDRPLVRPLLLTPSTSISTEAPEPTAAPIEVALWHPSPAAEVAAAPATVPSPVSVPPWWLRIVVAVWLGGAILGALVWAFEWRWLFRRLRGRTQIRSGAARALLDELCRRSGVRRHVALTSADGLAAPITLGLTRAEICLPPRAPDALDHEELEALLAHELAHAVRRDSAWLVAYRAISILFFFQPLNRSARIRLQDDAEYLADDWAVARTGERVALASCLTEVASWIVRERRLLPAPGMAARGARLSLRIRRLLDETHQPARDLPRLGSGVAAACALATVALLAPGVAADAGDHRSTASAPSIARDAALDLEEYREREDSDDIEEPGALTEEPAEMDAPVEPPDAEFAPLPLDLGAPPVAALETEAFESAVSLHGLAREIEALESEHAELVLAASRAPFDMRRRIHEFGLRLQGLRQRQQRLDALVELQARSIQPENAPNAAAFPGEESPTHERKERP